MHRRWSDYWHMLGVQYTLDIYLNSVDIYWFLATFKDLCWVLVSHWVDKPQVWCSTEYSQPLPSLLSSSLHLTEHVGVCWPQASSDESWVRSGQSIFFPPTCFCNRPSFQSEYLDTFYKVVSRKKKKKKQQILAALLWVFHWNRWIHDAWKGCQAGWRRLNAGIKLGVCYSTPQCEVCSPGWSKAWPDKQYHCKVLTIDKQEHLAVMEKSPPPLSFKGMGAGAQSLPY